MIFAVREVPALGFTTVYVTASGGEEKNVNKVRESPRETGKSGGLEISPSISADMLYYVGSKYNGQPSGAYVFRPDGGKHVLTDDPQYSQLTGPLVNESILELSDWGVLTARTYTDTTDLTELTWQVGPITGGKEVVLVVTTDILNTGGEFYTDANGRQMMRRVVRRDTAESVAANYYPVTTRLELRGQDTNLVSLLTDRSQGATSLNTGELEVMVHRRCEVDDWFGVGEALEETAFGAGLVARGSHLILAGSSLPAARLRQQESVLSPRLSLVGAALSLADWLSAEVRPYSALTNHLPDSLQVSESSYNQ